MMPYRHSDKTRSLGASLLWLCMAMGWAGCQDSPTLPAAPFSVPGGVAIAGPANAQRLFVLNQGEDALQVVNLGDADAGLRLLQAQFEPSPAQYFPLRVPVGPSPSAIAATPDGRYVVVLESGAGRLAVVDAEALIAVAPANSGSQESQINPGLPQLRFGGAMPVALAASQARPSVLNPCATPDDLQSQEAGCLGWFFVATDAADIWWVEITREGGLVPLRRYPVSMPVARLHASQDGEWLFFVEGGALSSAGQARLAQVPEVAAQGRRFGRLHRALGTEITGDLSATGGPLALSQDGRFLLVGRPALNDVVVVADPLDPEATELAPMPLDPVFGPTPKCIAACGDTLSCGNAAQLADGEICTDANGWQTTGQPYVGLGLSGAPAEMLTLEGRLVGTEGSEDTAENTAKVARVLRVGCAPNDAFGVLPQTDDTAASSQFWAFDQYAVVATLSGSMHVVGLSGRIENIDGQEIEGSDALEPQIVHHAPCTQPELSLSAVEGSDILPRIQSVGAILADCDAVDALGRQRFACVTPSGQEAGGGGLGLWHTAGDAATRGSISQAQTWALTLDWEGPLPLAGQTQRTGGGQVRDDGGFTDPNIDLSAQGILPGDILELTTPPQEGSSCAAPNPGGGLLSLAERTCRVVYSVVEVLPPVCADAADVDTTRCRDIAESARLVLDPPIGTDCYGTGAQIGYRVRVSEAFLATATQNDQVLDRGRLPLGAQYGVGGVLGRLTPLFGKVLPEGSDAASLLRIDRRDNCVRAQLATAEAEQADADERAGLVRQGDLCDAAAAQAGDEAAQMACSLLKRDRPVQLAIEDRRLRLSLGFGVSSRGELQTLAGALPTGIAAASHADGSLVFVSLAGNDAVFAFDPAQTTRIVTTLPADSLSADAYGVLQ